MIDFYLNWMGIISPGVPNLFGCFTLKVLEGPESSEPGPSNLFILPPKKKYFQWFQKIVVMRKKSKLQGLSDRDDLTFTATLVVAAHPIQNRGSLPERHGSRLRQCSREKSAVQDSAGGRKVPS